MVRSYGVPIFSLNIILKYSIFALTFTFIKNKVNVGYWISWDPAVNSLPSHC